jgi:putative transposase
VLDIECKRNLIDRGPNGPTIKRQCELLELPRSTLYYQPCVDSPRNIELMRLIDEIYTQYPEYGSRRIRFELNVIGYPIGRDLIRTLMRRMGIEAVYPKPNLSKGHPEHKIYPYLLRGVKIERVNQVWSTDITYIRMLNGFLYLTAVIDWYSRYVLSWKISNSLDGVFCREVLLDALGKGMPEIFNTDQGSQYTSPDFVSILTERGIRPSMDGRGRALDNVIVERLWRSVKYENVYLREYRNGLELRDGLEKYFAHYNERRPHMSLDYEFPSEVYRRG